MGDSITDIWAQQDPDFFTLNDFVGRGISGQTTSQMLVRFRRDVIDLRPQVVVIMAGTNDIARNGGYISPENTLGNLISMCELARANGIAVILCSIPPASRFWWREGIEPAAKVVELNAMIRDYAGRNSIPYLDYHSRLCRRGRRHPAPVERGYLPPERGVLPHGNGAYGTGCRIRTAKRELTNQNKIY